MELNYLRFDEIDSTNLYLKRNYDELPNWTIVQANFQTAGRGRFSRTFEVDKGKGMIESILLKDDFAFDNHELLSILTGVALCKTLEEYGFDPMIKWPNDVLLNGKKVSGILLESVINEKMEALIIGIGVNINQDKFSEELNNAISLKMISNKEFSVDEFSREFNETFRTMYENFMVINEKGFIDYVKNKNYFKDKFTYAYVKGAQKKVKVLDILDNGHLLVNDGTNDIEIESGEITFHNC
jgi:BirA family transcriptional regulator, biotin operon repressor / biotin---[acetyl-CoA-carboxylase] ligase